MQSSSRNRRIGRPYGSLVSYCYLYHAEEHALDGLLGPQTVDQKVIGVVFTCRIWTAVVAEPGACLVYCHAHHPAAAEEWEDGEAPALARVV